MSNQNLFEKNYKRSVDQEAQFVVSEILDTADREEYQREIYLDDVLKKARKIFEDMNV